ncbi:MAG: type II CRISPR RNA-guided endonuclease Cas9 [Planctomycetota bacterium]
MGSYTLGLDLGPSSIGWAAIETDEQGSPVGLMRLADKCGEYPAKGGVTIPATGARIFPAGVENLGQGQKEQTRNRKRRDSRGVRRTLRRRRARRLQLINLLRERNMLPEDDRGLAALQSGDPYELRKKALEDEGKVELNEIGRILLHFSKRRGFKSNRKDLDKDRDSGKVNEARTKLENSLNGKTVGQFWYEKRNSKERAREAIRNRRGEYKWIAEREMYEDELARIWKKQQAHYPGTLTKELHDRIAEVLFRQIPYEISGRKKRKVIGYCSVLKGKLRCGYSSRVAQEFRLLQKLNDVEVRRKGKTIEIEPERRRVLYDRLMVSKDVKFKDVRKLLELEDRDKINFEFEGNDGLIGNEIDSQLTKRGLIEKKCWLGLAEETKEQIWQVVLNHFNDEETGLENTVEEIERLGAVKLSKPESIVKIVVPTKTVKFSEEALAQIVPHMRGGLNLYQSIEKAGFRNKYKTVRRLPLPDEANGYRISNPNVRVVLFELRRLVNRLIEELGKPEKIVVEFAREIKASKEVRQRILRNQAQRRKLRDRIKEEIKSSIRWGGGEEVPNWAIEKYILWHEQKYTCPYSGSNIGLGELFSRDTEIDHILPYSYSLDNSLNNKVLCFAKENQEKGQRTVFDWLGNNEARWTKVLGAIDHWNPQRKTRGKRRPVKADMNLEELAGDNKEKWQRFFITSEEIDEVFWQPRLAPETGYIAREVRDYLKRLYNYKVADQKVVTTKGGITGELRKWWDLNGLLAGGNGQKKSREDLRHHALDAVVIACTSPAMIRRITDEMQRAWPLKRATEIFVPRPWQGFEDGVGAGIAGINVSHRVQRKVRGQLHKETHYWKEENGLYRGKFITRKYLDGSFTRNAAEHICDRAIRELVIERLDQHGNDRKKAFIEPVFLPGRDNKKTPVRKVRIWKESSTMKRIRGNIWVEPGKNHHIEIYEYIDGERKGERGGKVVTMFDAVERKNKGIRVIKTNHSPGKRFICSLSINEMFMLETEEGGHVLHRVQKLIQDGRIILRPHTFGGKISDSDRPPAIQRKSVSTLRGRKVTVDPLGRIRRAND